MGLDIKNSARLSYLRLTEAEMVHFSSQFSEIFKWIKRIETLDLALRDDAGVETPLRPDVALNELFNRPEMLQNAPQHDSSFFQAPGLAGR